MIPLAKAFLTFLYCDYYTNQHHYLDTSALSEDFSNSVPLRVKLSKSDFALNLYNSHKALKYNKLFILASYSLLQTLPNYNKLLLQFHHIQQLKY